MSDADCTPGREPRSIAASLNLNFSPDACLFVVLEMGSNALPGEFVGLRNRLFNGGFYGVDVFVHDSYRGDAEIEDNRTT